MPSLSGRNGPARPLTAGRTGSTSRAGLGPAGLNPRPSFGPAGLQSSGVSRTRYSCTLRARSRLVVYQPRASGPAPQPISAPCRTICGAGCQCVHGHAALQIEPARRVPVRAASRVAPPSPRVHGGFCQPAAANTAASLSAALRTEATVTRSPPGPPGCALSLCSLPTPLLAQLSAGPAERLTGTLGPGDFSPLFQVIITVTVVGVPWQQGPGPPCSRHAAT